MDPAKLLSLSRDLKPEVRKVAVIRAALVSGIMKRVAEY